MTERKIHLHYPIFWTACNMSAAELPAGTEVHITKAKDKVTCQNCRRTQGFFSRDDFPQAETQVRRIGIKAGLMACSKES